ncbi:uncharacterized protein LOC106162370 [Lingula anatina]|uniref:Uncharacterized protein LOC106162370 n=1 Tax=Lingula anatina TaxID=7574 RepID=A0A1S3IB72_LINAN|nr:uncharacterized protein LOC106162370 [Lingula anatina]|eukprot:XP_013395101.1 uncharacterized protein LOC106162370 [Lingula anatina]
MLQSCFKRSVHLFNEFTRLSEKDIKSAMAKNLDFYEQGLVNLPQPKGKGASMRRLSSELQEAKEAIWRLHALMLTESMLPGVLCLPLHLKEECGCLLRKFSCLGDSVQPIITSSTQETLCQETKFYIYLKM